MRYCVVMPTYNNAKTVYQVATRALVQCPDVIVVNDGSTDDTLQLLEPLAEKEGVCILSYSPNRGKGYALRRGLEKAVALGFDYAITLDSDGQHYPEDIPRMIAATDESRPLVVGCRNLRAEGMPGGNGFANRFSNFWFTMQTGLRLPDTQTGFRAYPLARLPRMRWLGNRYESELALLVLAAWRGVPLKPVEVNVDYCPAGGRVSHFRPCVDFVRISLLNILLCVLSLCYGYPSMWIRKCFVHRQHGKSLNSSQY